MFGEYSLEIYAKDFRRPLRIMTKHLNSIYERLSRYVFPTLKDVFAFSGGQCNPKGWQYFDFQKDYKRMGVGAPNSKWRFTNVNSDYSLCSSYPTCLAVPHEITDEELKVETNLYFFLTTHLGSCIISK